MKKRMNSKLNGFTLLELLVVIAIIGLLASVVIVSSADSKDSAKGAVIAMQAREYTLAMLMYYNDMGFYPPDVNRGWDPGLVRAMPWNPDIEAGITIPGTYQVSGANCAHCPTNWATIVAARWNGPYLGSLPVPPWRGTYDYNYWTSNAMRSNLYVPGSPCLVVAGAYLGTQPDYWGENRLPLRIEEKLINDRIESEACLNGESQIRIIN